MFSIYKLTFGKNISKIINLKTVSSVYQCKNRLTITYNYTKSEGLLILGSGYINTEPYTEVIHCENDDIASQQINDIEGLLKKIN